ncbi:serine acetyltransferase [bacterium]|nr:serine acetyltransferase [bacterium]
METSKQKAETCRQASEIPELLENRLSSVTEKIIDSCSDPDCYIHVDYEPIPSVELVIEILNHLREIIFPGYFNSGRMNPANLKYNMGRTISVVYELLAEQIANSVRHDCFRYEKDCSDCRSLGRQTAVAFLEDIPHLRKILSKDVEATFDGDPSAKSYDEIIFSYPGIQAITIYRIAHALYKLEVPILPRTMTEYAHNKTGIDIHPGATIGERFVIDHGTGVVIGETALIGNNVRIYQGVTLGAHSLPPDAGSRMKGVKRHPTIEDDVIIYSGATILGGKTVIGSQSVVGGNVWLTESIPANTKVVMEKPRLIYN